MEDCRCEGSARKKISAEQEQRLNEEVQNYYPESARGKNKKKASELYNVIIGAKGCQIWS